MLKKHKSLLQNAAAILVLTGVGLYLLSIFEVSQTILFSIGGAVLFVVTFSVTVRITYTSRDDAAENPDSKPTTRANARPRSAALTADDQYDRKAILNHLDHGLVIAGVMGVILTTVFSVGATPIIQKMRGAEEVWGISLNGDAAFLLLFLSATALPGLAIGLTVATACIVRHFAGPERFWSWHPQIKAIQDQE